MGNQIGVIPSEVEGSFRLQLFKIFNTENTKITEEKEKLCVLCEPSVISVLKFFEGLRRERPLDFARDDGL